MSSVATMTRAAGVAVNSMPGRFGAYGGRYVPETLMAALLELDQAYAEAQADPAFHAELDGLLKDYCGRPTPLYFAKPADGDAGWREDLFEARRPAAYGSAQD